MLCSKQVPALTCEHKNDRNRQQCKEKAAYLIHYNYTLEESIGTTCRLYKDKFRAIRYCVQMAFMNGWILHIGRRVIIGRWNEIGNTRLICFVAGKRP